MKIRVHFFIILSIVMVIFFKDISILMLFLAAALHELGHILAARLMGISFSEFKFDLLGAGLGTDTSLLSYGQEILLCLAGPLTNLTVALVLLHVPIPHDNIYSNYFILSSLFLGILNLFPIKSFDGGRVFYVIVEKLFNINVADKLSAITSFIMIFFMWSLALFLLMRFTFSLSLFIFSISLFSRIFITGKK